MENTVKNKKMKDLNELAKYLFEYKKVKFEGRSFEELVLEVIVELSYLHNNVNSLKSRLPVAYIKLLEIAGYYKFDMNRIATQHIVNNKKSFEENIYAIIREIASFKYTKEEAVNYTLLEIKEFAKIMNIELEVEVNTILYLRNILK
ncbi:hypothetical protein ETU08_00160 [Apibacter muscae]|uniref:hypothetical protein n=1 Tax=Apibacter muscae TaxID=2509004 RepID=UPI0011ABE669|nr:hypothetical protein [Apibacter muscae]TWP31907.1 hypothetical protein ETU08_00160 [Apibacter muscae]